MKFEQWWDSIEAERLSMTKDEISLAAWNAATEAAQKFCLAQRDQADESQEGRICNALLKRCADGIKSGD